jgi:hypothetical protein
MTYLDEDEDVTELHVLEPSEEPIQYDGVFTDVFSAAIVPPHWIVRDVLPPGLVFLAADPKVGKSSFAAALAALVAGYECKALPPFLSVVNTPGPVLIFSAEASAGELRFMLEDGLGVRGSSDAGILVADDPWEFRLDEPGGTAKFLSWCEKRKPRMVVLDPLRNFHSQDENDSGAMYSLLRPLRQWAVENGACLVVVHHTRKATEGTEAVSVERMRGTSAMFGMVDGAIVMGDGGGGYADVEATFKRARKWRKKILIASYDKRGMSPTELMDTVDKAVLTALEQGAADAEEVAKLAKTTPQKVALVLEKLKRNGLWKGKLNAATEGK